ncbi:jerky protein homolog-like [Daktulosphaira vitifoliae]|uniref:jerky protein homolog-like n=2 Tax=Daktulosphaira vitifoliae TaxID=58002 RepID=UPI0021AAA446|nr:jerky protein homolog-like [Daktulosphaira vitifoliae]
MSEKRKKVLLSIQDKLELINDIKKGTSKKQISLKYGIGESTVRDIFKQKDKLMKFASASDNNSSMKKRKTMKTSTYKELDAALLQWINQVRSEGTPVSGPIVSAKAKQFFEMLGLEGKFDASSGWLTRFKKRHGIREIGINGDKLSCDEQAAEDFKIKFEQFLQKEKISYEQLYSADESGLFWKCLPTRTLAFESERHAPGHKSSKERLTIMTCSNATGSQKLKLVVIGKSKKPRSFKGTRAENLPVHYFNQKKAWINQEIFKEWFEKKFIPQVREHLKSQNLPQKAVLLIDNAPSHPVNLKSEDGNIFVKFLPPNVTALIQPMDQGVIASIKKNYRTSLLKKRIEEGNDLKSFWKDYTILDSIYDINTAWGLVKQTTLVKSWRKILPCVENTLIEEEEEVSAFDLANFSKSLTGGENFDEENINEWINCDANDPGFERLSDEQIVSGALDTVSESEGEEEENDEINDVKQVSHEEALKHIDGIIKYLEEQDDTTLCDKMLLKKLQSQVKKKSFQTKKQKLLTDFFN